MVTLDCTTLPLVSLLCLKALRNSINYTRCGQKSSLVSWKALNLFKLEGGCFAGGSLPFGVLPFLMLNSSIPKILASDLFITLVHISCHSFGNQREESDTQDEAYVDRKELALTASVVITSNFI